MYTAELFILVPVWKRFILMSDTIVQKNDTLYKYFSEHIFTIALFVSRFRTFSHHITGMTGISAILLAFGWKGYRSKIRNVTFDITCTAVRGS